MVSVPAPPFLSLPSSFDLLPLGSVSQLLPLTPSLSALFLFGSVPALLFLTWLLSLILPLFLFPTCLVPSHSRPSPPASGPDLELRPAGLQEVWAASSFPLPGCDWTGTGSFPVESGSQASPPPHLTGAAAGLGSPPTGRPGMEATGVSLTSQLKVSRAGGRAEEESELGVFQRKEGSRGQVNWEYWT